MKSGAKIKPILQPEEDACGPVALEIASLYFNKNLSFTDITVSADYDRDEGMSNSDLVRAAQKIGFSTEVITNAAWEDLESNNTPKKLIVVSWMLHGYIGHFSVVDHVSDTHIYLNNPETGEIDEIEKIIFLRLWFDYDEHWYPEKNTDIQLRWMIVLKE